MDTPQADQFLAAFLQFQRDVKQPQKNKQNPHFGNRYSDLGAIWETIRKPLCDNDLVIIQKTISEPSANGGPASVMLVTRCQHIGGGYREAVYPVEPVQNTPQGKGSALTYARRYSICTLLGIVGEDDDDGEIALRRKERKTKLKTETKAAPPDAHRSLLEAIENAIADPSSRPPWWGKPMKIGPDGFRGLPWETFEREDDDGRALAAWANREFGKAAKTLREAGIDEGDLANYDMNMLALKLALIIRENMKRESEKE